MKKKCFILFLLIIMIFMPSVKAGYNGSSSDSGISPGTGSCDSSWNDYCLWNTGNTRGLQITLYYFNSDGSRTQVGKQIHVVKSKQKFTDAGFTSDWLAGLIEDSKLDLFNSSKLETYFLSEGVYETYIETYIGVSLDDLTLPSDVAPAPNGRGYRLVIEPMVSTLRKGTVYLKTVKEIAEVGITRSGEKGKKALEELSTLLYLEKADVGVSAGNSNGTSDLSDMKNVKSGWGYNIIDISNIIPDTCEWTTETSCCDEKNNLTGTDLDNFKLAHPACFDTAPEASTTTTCDFTLNASISSACTPYASGGSVKDMDNWGCIYESAASDNATVRGYFLKYGSTTSTCAVYCRDELEYEYPKEGMVALAGTYFTIANTLNSYRFELAGNEYKATAATLGPIKVTVKRECSITGTADAGCNSALQTQLNNLRSSSPTIKFTYDSNYYGEVTTTLSATKTSETDATNPANQIKSRTITFEYKLPSDTYKYASKNTGISYKTISSAGRYPTLYIGPHLPLHFSQTSDEIDFEINIEKFNLPNFDNLVISGTKMPTQYTTSIESYIKTLIDGGNATPTKIGNIYYLGSSFVNLLSAKGYSVANFLYMDCADTSNYTCHNNANGIFCYDEGKTSNSTSTYALFNACIGQIITSGTKSYQEDLKYECSFDVDNIPDNPNKEDPDGDLDGMDVIFRPISLDDPFPSIDGDGRVTGTNWCYGDDCSNTNPVVEEVILNNRGVESGEIYTELDPLYKIVLTPALIKQIRAYNDTTTYADFNLECSKVLGVSTGNNCKSNFLRTRLNNGEYNFSNYFSGCGIAGKSYGLDCGYNEAW